MREKNAFSENGKIERIRKLKIPRKIIDAPLSRYGGRPTQFDPKKISVKNYSQKLNEALEEGGPFDNTFLYLAARNNNITATTYIAEKLSSNELAQAFTTKTTKFDISNSLTPLDAAIKESNSEIIEII